MRFVRPIILAALLAGLAACAGDGNKSDSLYGRLGERAGIAKVVDDFTARVAADNRINRFFAKTDIPAFKRHLTDQLCQASGGPCVYKGRSMQESHKGMNISVQEFNWTGGHLAAALNAAGVAPADRDAVLSVAGSLQKDIVGQ